MLLFNFCKRGEGKFKNVSYNKYVNTAIKEKVEEIIPEKIRINNIREEKIKESMCPMLGINSIRKRHNIAVEQNMGKYKKKNTNYTSSTIVDAFKSAYKYKKNDCSNCKPGCMSK